LPLSKSVIALPLEPNVVSRVPLALKRAMAKTSLPDELVA